MLLYGLNHEYENVEEGYDEVTRIAVYSTYEKAEAGLKKFQNHPKFRQHPEGFSIDEILVDLIGWSEGFVPWDD